MKPTEWDELPLEEKKQIATRLFKSVRGSYIIGQALYLGAQALKEKKPFPEISNAEDMEMLTVLFFPYGEVEQTLKGFAAPAT